MLPLALIDYVDYYSPVAIQVSFQHLSWEMVNGA